MAGNRPTQEAWIPAPADDVLVGRYFRRTGSCNQCGRCCTDIYLMHQGQPIASLDQFAGLQALHPEYRFLVPLDVTERGVLFHCSQLGDDGLCRDYGSRPGFCRTYPSEVIPLRQGQLPEECGYRFELMVPFRQLMARMAEQRPAPTPGRPSLWRSWLQKRWETRYGKGWMRK